jgi:hypothetical protein
MSARRDQCRFSFFDKFHFGQPSYKRSSKRSADPAFTWVEKVQLWSCRERYRDMTAEQGRFCFGYGYGPRYGYGYASPRYGYG